LGCWAIGGPYWHNGNANGWGKVDDNESISGIHKAIDNGVNFFDTADIYGCGHSEKILAKAIQGKRDQMIIATKFGITFDELELEMELDFINYERVKNENRNIEQTITA